METIDEESLDDRVVILDENEFLLGDQLHLGVRGEGEQEVGGVLLVEQDQHGGASPERDQEEGAGHFAGVPERDCSVEFVYDAVLAHELHTLHLPHLPTQHPQVQLFSLFLQARRTRLHALLLVFPHRR